MTITRPDDLFPTFRQAFLAGNTDDIVALYEDDAIFFDLDGNARGLEEIRARFDAFFAAARIVDYQVHQRDEQLLGPDHACGAMTFSCTVETIADGSRAEVEGRSAEVFRRGDAGWRFVVDHVSLPMG